MWKLSPQCLLLGLIISLENFSGFDGLSAPPLLAKGLDELSNQSPEQEDKVFSEDGKAKDADEAPGKVDDSEEAAADEDKTSDKDKAEAKESAKPGAVSKALEGKLSLDSSFGWVHVAQQGGSWRSSGMSDISVAYKFAILDAKSSIAATYRYAPVAVSATIDGQSYRGVWETHYVGIRYSLLTTSTLAITGSAEVGALRVALRSVDGLKPQSGVAKSGAVGAVGLGLERYFFEHNAFAVGPRIYYTGGKATMTQTAIALGYFF